MTEVLVEGQSRVRLFFNLVTTDRWQLGRSFSVSSLARCPTLEGILDAILASSPVAIAFLVLLIGFDLLDRWKADIVDAVVMSDGRGGSGLGIENG